MGVFLALELFVTNKIKLAWKTRTFKRRGMKGNRNGVMLIDKVTESKEEVNKEASSF